MIGEAWRSVSISLCQSLSVGDRLIDAAPDPSISAAGPVAEPAHLLRPESATRRGWVSRSAATTPAVTGDGTAFGGLAGRVGAGAARAHHRWKTRLKPRTAAGGAGRGCSRRSVWCEASRLNTTHVARPVIPRTIGRTDRHAGRSELGELAGDVAEVHVHPFADQLVRLEIEHRGQARREGPAGIGDSQSAMTSRSRRLSARPDRRPPPARPQLARRLRIRLRHARAGLRGPYPARPEPGGGTRPDGLLQHRRRKATGRGAEGGLDPRYRGLGRTTRPGAGSGPGAADPAAGCARSWLGGCSQHAMLSRHQRAPIRS